MFVDVCRNYPQSPIVINKAKDKVDEECLENATKTMLRDMSHTGDGYSSDDELPAFNKCQMVDALTLPKDWEPMDINGVGRHPPQLI